MTYSEYGLRIDNRHLEAPHLLLPGAETTLQEDIQKAAGKAVVVIHPLCPSTNPNDYTNASYASEYRAYVNQLKREVREYTQNGVPVILLEQITDSTNLQDELQQIGIDRTDKAYVMLTDLGSPDPYRSTMTNFSEWLISLGLREVTVLGAYHFPNGPQITNGIALEGCVTYAIRSLNDTGIQANAGNATYQRRGESN